MLIATAYRRWLVRTALAGPVLRLASSSSNSIRKLVSSSSIAVASAPGPCSLALKCFHRRQQVPRGQCRSLRENAPNYPGERLLGVTLFPHQQIIGVYFDGDGFGSHTQTMHGPCMGIKQQEPKSLFLFAGCRIRAYDLRFTNSPLALLYTNQHQTLSERALRVWGDLREPVWQALECCCAAIAPLRSHRVFT